LSLQEGKQTLVFFLVVEDAGHGGHGRRHAGQYQAVLQRSAEKKALRVLPELVAGRDGSCVKLWLEDMGIWL